MSGIAGIVQFDGAPAGEAGLAAMLASMAHRGPDGRSTQVRGSIALGYLALHTTMEAASESQPVHEPEADLTLVFEGRIDNADECRRLLAAHGPEPRTRSDAELVLCAYEHWGAECAAHLLGDFAFAVWDGRQRRLFAARDIIGIKPLFYRWTKHQILFASEPQALLCDPALARRPNEGMAAEHLAGIVTSKAETLIQGVFRLPPAHVLVADERDVRLRRYWQADPDRVIRYRSDREYEERLRELFAEAVRCRQRTVGPLGVMLSGGLDSSSIVGMAESLRRNTGGPAVRPFSMTFPDRPCDEGRFVRAVNQMWGLTGESLGDVPMDWVSSAHGEVRRYLDIPALPNNTAADPIRMVARARGVRVLLFGLGGDEWLRGSPAYYADLFRRGRLVSLVRQVRFDRGDTDFVGLRRAARLAVWPLVPHAAKRAVKRLVKHDLLPAWLDRRFVERTELRARLERFRPEVRFKEMAKTDSFTEATSGQVTLALEHLDRSLAWLGLEARHPFHDRRVIEFALAVPSKQHWWAGYSKSLLRRAMRDLLPPVVRERRWAPNYWHLMNGALTAHAQAGSFVPRATAELGWLEPGAFGAQADRLMPAILQGDRRLWPSVWPLWSTCAIELWARGALQTAA